MAFLRIRGQPPDNSSPHLEWVKGPGFFYCPFFADVAVASATQSRCARHLASALTEFLSVNPPSPCRFSGNETARLYNISFARRCPSSSALTLFEPPAPPAPRMRDGGLLATRLAGKHAALITGHFVLPGREGRYAELPDDFPKHSPPRCARAACTQLYATSARPGTRRSAASTSSSPRRPRRARSLCYTLPVVAAAMTRAGEGAVPVPDQGAGAGPGRRAAGTQPRRRPRPARRSPSTATRPATRARRSACNGDIVVSNPDMLHQGDPAAPHQVGAVLREPAATS